MIGGFTELILKVHLSLNAGNVIFQYVMNVENIGGNITIMRAIELNQSLYDLDDFDLPFTRTC
jgi:hypothetical protein